MSRKGRKGKGRKKKKGQTGAVVREKLTITEKEIPEETANTPPERSQEPEKPEAEEKKETEPRERLVAAVTEETAEERTALPAEPGKSWQHPLALLLSCLLLSAWIIMLISQLITIHELGETLSWMFTHPEPVMLVCGVLTALGAVLWAAFRRLWLAFVIPGVLVILFSALNYYKMVINNMPLLFSDLSYAPHLLPITRFAAPQVRLDGLMLGSALAMFLTGFLLYRVDRRMPKIRWSRVGLAAGGLVFFGFFCMTDCFLEPAAAVAAEYRTQEERIAYCGSLWAFYCAYAASEKGQESYSVEDMHSLISYLNTMNDIDRQEKDEDFVPPDVIFVMNESFFDVTRLPNVEFAVDPLPNYHRLAKEHTSGRFLSNTCNGGTGYVELEVMTGLCSNLLNEGDTLPYLRPETVYDRIPSIARVFKENGYHLTFLHSHTDELYNRPAVYRRLGFDELYFRDSFPENVEIRGDYISDRAFADKVIELYEARDPEQPFMMMSVTMENHQPSYEGKFQPDADIPFKSPTLDATGRNILQSYLTGVNDADASLGQLVDYFSRVERPVMLVFWGDHLPSMAVNNNETVFSELGVYESPASITWNTEQLKTMLTTDYLVWSNYEKEKDPPHTESCMLLGLYVLKRVGFTLTDYYAWMEKAVAPEMLLYRPRLFVDAAGTASPDVPEEDAEMMDRYAKFEYDIIYGGNEILSSLRTGK